MNREKVIDALRNVKYPGFSRDIVSFGIVKEVSVDDKNRVSFVLAIPTEKEEIANEIEEKARKAVKEIGNIKEISVDVRKKEISSKSMSHGSDPWAGREPILGVKRVIAIASGKGGVGKSTVAVNLAIAFSQLGNKVGLLDADVYGPSLPTMLGVKEKPKVMGEDILVPVEKWGLKLMSIGFLLEEDTPVIWRGPMVNQLVQHFLKKVAWGELDYLVIDLPPGTGDAQLTLVQNVPLSGAVIVTTPSDVALIDARRGLRMFEKVNTPVLGIVENMSYFICPHCHKETDVFSKGGGRKVSEELGVPFLGEIPLHSEIRRKMDEGEPVVRTLSYENQEAKVFLEVAQATIKSLEETGLSIKGFREKVLSRLQ